MLRKGLDGTRHGALSGEDDDGGCSKMSAILVDLARPWLDRLGPNPSSPAVEFGYRLSALMWNLSRLPNVESRESRLKSVLPDVITNAPNGTEHEVERFAIGAYRRAMEFYPDDPREIEDVIIENREAGRFHVTVASFRPGEGD